MLLISQKLEWKAKTIGGSRRWLYLHIITMMITYRQQVNGKRNLSRKTLYLYKSNHPRIFFFFVAFIKYIIKTYIIHLYNIIYSRILVHVRVLLFIIIIITVHYYKTRKHRQKTDDYPATYSVIIIITNVHNRIFLGREYPSAK